MTAKIGSPETEGMAGTAGTAGTLEEHASGARVHAGIMVTEVIVTTDTSDTTSNTHGGIRTTSPDIAARRLRAIERSWTIGRRQSLRETTGHQGAPDLQILITIGRGIILCLSGKEDIAMASPSDMATVALTARVADMREVVEGPTTTDTAEEDETITSGLWIDGQ